MWRKGFVVDGVVRMLTWWLWYVVAVGLGLVWGCGGLDVGREQAKTFVVGYEGNVGSRSVLSTLYQHPKLKVLRIRGEKGNTKEYMHLLDRHFQDGRLEDTMTGLKVRLESLEQSPEEWSEMIRKFETRFIALTRENVFTAGLEMYGPAWLHDCISSTCKVYVPDVHQLARSMQAVEKNNERLVALASALPWSYYLNVKHDDYISDPKGTMDRIYDFLGVSREEYRSYFEKTVLNQRFASNNPCAMLVNYQAVCAALWGCTRFRPFLENTAGGCICLDKSLPVTEELCPDLVQGAENNASASAFQPQADICTGKAKSFLLGGVGHSGSTAVISSLYKHPELAVQRPYEPLRKYLKFDRAQRKAEAIFDEVTGRLGLTAGFKMRPTQTKGCIDKWAKMAQKYSTRFISLTRQNTFLTGIGLYNIRARNNTSVRMGLISMTSEEYCALNPDVCSFEIKDIGYLSFLMLNAERGVKQTEEVASTIPWPCRLDLTYEEYESDPQSTMQRIYRFLGVTEMDLQPSVNKALPGSACKLLTNYQEVCAQLWACEQFQPFLEDARNGCFCEDKTRPRLEKYCTFSRFNYKSPCSYTNSQGLRRGIPCAG